MASIFGVSILQFYANISNHFVLVLEINAKISEKQIMSKSIVQNPKDNVLNNGDLLGIILSFLPQTNIFKLRGICKLWKFVAEKPKVWFNYKPVKVSVSHSRAYTAEGNYCGLAIEQPFLPWIKLSFEIHYGFQWINNKYFYGEYQGKKRILSFESEDPNEETRGRERDNELNSSNDEEQPKVDMTVPWRKLQISERISLGKGHDFHREKNEYKPEPDSWVQPTLWRLSESGALTTEAWLELTRTLLFTAYFTQDIAEFRSSKIALQFPTTSLPENFLPSDTNALGRRLSKNAYETWKELEKPPTVTQTKDGVIFSTTLFTDWGGGYWSMGGYDANLYDIQVDLTSKELKMRCTSIKRHVKRGRALS